MTAQRLSRPMPIQNLFRSCLPRRDVTGECAAAIKHARMLLLRCSPVALLHASTRHHTCGAGAQCSSPGGGGRELAAAPSGPVGPPPSLPGPVRQPTVATHAMIQLRSCSHEGATSMHVTRSGCPVRKTHCKPARVHFGKWQADMAACDDARVLGRPFAEGGAGAPGAPAAGSGLG